MKKDDQYWEETTQRNNEDQLCLWWEQMQAAEIANYESQQQHLYLSPQLELFKSTGYANIIMKITC